MAKYVENGVFTRGKHVGEAVAFILEEDPQHVVWVVENVGDHGISRQDYDTAVIRQSRRKLNPNSPFRRPGTQSAVKNDELVFLSVPYSDPDPAVVEARIEALLVVDAYLMSAGTYTVSPCYKHLLVKHDLDLPSTWEYWQDYCRTLLRPCSRMIIVPAVGWEESVGVKGEVKICRELGKTHTVFNLELLNALLKERRVMDGL